MPDKGVRWVRAIPFALAAFALAALTVENATVVGLGDEAPETAAAVWPSHPNVQLALASRQIAAASGAGKPVPPATFAMVEQAAANAPLDPQPFLVAGVRAQLAGNMDQAVRAFQAAQLRNPRSLPARYFLATSRLQRGDIAGLRDIAGLARLDPNGGRNMVPYLAAFAAQPGAHDAMRALFRDNPGIRSAVLSSLADDPANLRLVLALGGTARGTEAPWYGRLINSLIASKRYGEARALWERSSGVTKSGLFDPQFRDSAAPPPFNWELTTSSIGLAERRSGRLQVIYYGQDSGILARQLLLLPPGRYRLDAPASGTDAGALLWIVRCDGGTELARSPAGRGGLPFAVPAECPAQWIELAGSASDFGRQADMTIGSLRLEAVPR